MLLFDIRDEIVHKKVETFRMVDEPTGIETVMDRLPVETQAKNKSILVETDPATSLGTFLDRVSNTKATEWALRTVCDVIEQLIAAMPDEGKDGLRAKLNEDFRWLKSDRDRALRDD